jgi:hypothetical protein
MPQFFVRQVDGSEITLEAYRAMLERLIAHERDERVAGNLRACLAATFRTNN